MDFFIDIGITVKALIKLRDSLNLAFPPNLRGDAGKGFKIVVDS